jgi:hypothetical protein
MTIQRTEHVGIVVDDLAASIESERGTRSRQCEVRVHQRSG